MTHRFENKRTATRGAFAIACAVGLALSALSLSRAADAPALINPTAGGTAAAPAPVAAPAAGAQTPFNIAASKAQLGDMTQWGGSPHRNMVSAEKNPPTEWDVETGKNILWAADLGSKAYSGPTVANGKLYVGTNNEGKRDPKFSDAEGSAIDGGVVMCFDEKSGKFLWQRYYPKLPSGRVNDWPQEGICSTPYAEGDRLWYCNNRCEVVCLDVSGSAPSEVWKLDMMSKLGVFPHNMTSASITSYKEYIYVITGNGVDDTHKNVVAPKAPGIVCLEKNTGKVVWTDNPAGENVLHGQWSSVAITEVKKADGTIVPLVIAPLGDAWIYAYHAETGKLVWKFDSNPKDAVYPQTRNEIIATPVIVGNRMYIANGQDPEHGQEDAHLWCIDITREGDISPEISDAPKPKIGEELVVPAAQAANRKGKPNPNSGVVWHFFKEDFNGDGKIKGEEQFHRSISTVAVTDGLCFAADFSGFLHCLDANTGKQYWAADLEAEIWASPMVIDGKVYIGNYDGDVTIFEVGKTMKQIGKYNMGMPVASTPVMANGTLYIMGMQKLFAIKTGAQAKPTAEK